MQLVQSFKLMGMLKWIYYMQSSQPPFIHMTWEGEPKKMDALPRNGEIF